MLVGHMADIHVGANHFGVQDYPEDTLEAFSGALEALVKERPDVIVIAGDLFDRPRPENRLVIEVTRLLRRVAREEGIPVVLATGEHDQPARRDVPSVRLVAEAAGDGVYAPTPDPAKPFVEIMREMTVRVNGGHVMVLPFTRGSPERRRQTVARLLEAAGAVARGLDGRVVLAAHIGLSTATVPDDAVADPAQLPPVDYVALGHVHRPYEGGGSGGIPPHAYPGTLVPIRVDEVRYLDDEKRGPILVDLSSGEASLQRIKVDPPRSHVVARVRLTSLRDALRAIEEALRGVPRRRKPTLLHLYLTLPPNPSLARSGVVREVTGKAEEYFRVVARVVAVRRERPRARHATPTGGASEVEVAESILGDRELASLVVKLKEALLAGDQEQARELLGEILSGKFDGAWSRILKSRPPRGLGVWLR
ncbi:metallophosphoesterase family protein [Stetteria hydrogenophila]